MAEARDGFLRAMDSENTGINGKIKSFENLLMELDPELFNHLND